MRLQCARALKICFWMSLSCDTRVFRHTGIDTDGQTDTDTDGQTDTDTDGQTDTDTDGQTDTDTDIDTQTQICRQTQTHSHDTNRHRHTLAITHVRVARVTRESPFMSVSMCIV